MLAGESKHQILQLLPPASIAPAFLIDPRSLDLASIPQVVQQQIAQHGWTFPLICKPDRGCRGSGVRLIRSPQHLTQLLSSITESMLIQHYHPGPGEVGIFYFRRPSQSTGHILSITRKVFPRVTGDGISTLAQLITHHPRLRLQFHRFAARHAAQLHHIPPQGQSIPLCIAGNHCQGTMFQDGSDLITPQLLSAIDSIARATPGFYFGRFDVRYQSDDDLKQAKDLCIIELNGIASESTNVYDPAISIWRAYRTWALAISHAFAIGAENRAAGAPLPSLLQTLRLISAARAQPNLNGLSD
jgi:hypothetical protein